MQHIFRIIEYHAFHPFHNTMANFNFLIFTFFSGTNPFHVWMWAQLAVFLHVFVDIFNSYGTQALRPITNKWIQLSVINTFDLLFSQFFVLVLYYGFIGFASICSLLPIIALLIIYYMIRFKNESRN